MNSNISHQTSHLSCSPHSFYNSKLLLYVSNYLICVNFCFSKGILKETSQTKIPVRYLIPILNIYHHALGKGNLAERVVYPYKEWRITQILSLSNYTINSDNHKTFPENFLQWDQLDKNHSNSSHICLWEQLCFVFTQFFFPRCVLTRHVQLNRGQTEFNSPFQIIFGHIWVYKELWNAFNMMFQGSKHTYSYSNVSERLKIIWKWLFKKTKQPCFLVKESLIMTLRICVSSVNDALTFFKLN